MITSTHNPKIQQVRALIGKPRARREAQAFVVEGVRLVEEAHASGWEAQLVLYTEQLSPRGQEVVKRMVQAGTPVELVSDQVMNSIGDTENPQGILAVLPFRQLPIPAQLDFALIADTVRDPGNLGTLLRTAAAAGVQAAFLSPATVDPYSPKVVRAAMGAHFYLPILKLGWEEIRTRLKSPLGAQPLRVYLGDAGGQQDYWEPDFRQPTAISVGSEAEGASLKGIELADETIRIPMPGKSESLNAAIAAAILLFEVVRQRRETYLPDRLLT